MIKQAESREPPTKRRPIDERFVRDVAARLATGRPVRRTLPELGRLHIDRPLPFLCVYRKPLDHDDPGTDRLAASEASYLIGSATKRAQRGMNELVRAVVDAVMNQFGTCLVLELWAGPPVTSTSPATTAELVPQFKVVEPKPELPPLMTDQFIEALSRVKLGKHKSLVTKTTSARWCPPGMTPLLGAKEAAAIGCHVFGLEVAPVFRDANTGELFHGVLRQFRHRMTVALRRAFFEFACRCSTARPEHYHSLGRNAVVKAVWDADRLLAEASSQFDLLLQLTPVNGFQAWQEFKRRKFAKAPVFHYRPLPVDTVVLKRALYKAPVERVEDPALGQLLREKLDALDRQITMLLDRNTPRFLNESLQLFGGVEDELHALATELLERVPSRSRDESSKQSLGPEEFARLAREEIDYFRKQDPRVTATVEIRDDVSSLMVSRGNLLISTQTRIPLSRAAALIQHEVGTHVLTYHNGRAQRFHQLSSGLAGYDALQEGLAVLTEYLVGGLSRPRIRLLAARVIAAKAMIDGASFVETFNELDDRYDFSQQAAFSVTMRAYRGGGLTKDVVYLRGLCELLEYLGGGGELEPLLVGKISTQHIPIVRELQWRGVLRDPPLVPRYLEDPAAQRRLEALRQGMTVLDLIAKERKR